MQYVKGPYDELHTINKTATQFDQRLPMEHHAGYIVISFKLLREQTQRENLEKSWLNWSGAREIYKYSPSNWNLRRISLHRISNIRDRRRGSDDDEKECARSGLSSVFHYVLLCEFSSIFHPSNRLQALDMCERLKVRNCGYISLYRVKHSYSSTRTTEETMVPKTTSRRERNPMIRGFSQEVAMPEGGTSPRIPKLRLRDHSLGYDIDETLENDRNLIFEEFE
ncbi:unnamed protein product [Enterobius vermicularis]|uniref:CP2 domain-containing protein n=1 Tax=Enterobius vermicularis TaxID=51028 RepID=A0A0N4VGU4_ENTVE|nr:unnamed protein product [Enterobius vermicularis]